jgi:hypothetical protein
MFQKPTHTKENEKVVTGSAIVAKATVKRSNGRIETIVVYQESTRHEFYWIYATKSTRTPRRAWKYAGTRGRDTNVGQGFADFGTFVATYARINQAQVLQVRVLHIRRMASLLGKTNHESIHADWTPQDLTKASADMQSKRLQNKMKGHFSW